MTGPSTDDHGSHDHGADDDRADGHGAGTRSTDEAAAPTRAVPPVPLPPAHAAPSYTPGQEGAQARVDHSRYAPPGTGATAAAGAAQQPQGSADDHAREADRAAVASEVPAGTEDPGSPSASEAVLEGQPSVPAPAPVTDPLGPPSYAPGATPSAHWFDQARADQADQAGREKPAEASTVSGWPATDGPHGRRRGLGAAAVTGLLVGALLLGAVGGIVGERVWDSVSGPSSQPLPTVSADPSITRPDGSIADIAATVAPSVVSLYVSGPDGQSTGSGFVIREDGYILTNNHVIAGAVGNGEIRVTFVDGSESTATLIGRTADYDLAVVRVDREDLVPLVLGDSEAVAVGDPVIAIGAPLGLDGTVTTGIISALNRPVSAGDVTDQAFINALQTDAAINPGNSGGPLVDASGQVIGINSAIAQPPGTLTSAGNIGLGFAIGSNQARRTAQEIIDTGSASYPIIGVLLDSSYDGEGVQVVQDAQGGQEPVTPGGPAEAAGLAPGDVILSVDGRPVTQSDELIVAIRAKAPGDTVVLKVRSGDDERDVSIVLDKATSGEG